MRLAVAASIISVRQGAASTWQCRQAWLHLRPTLICRACSRSRRSVKRCSESLCSNRFIVLGHSTRLRYLSISILTLYKTAPVGLRINVIKLAQRTDAQFGLINALECLGKNLVGAPGNVAKEIRPRLAQADQPIASIGSRADHHVMGQQTRPGGVDVFRRNRRAIRTNDDDPLRAFGEGFGE